MRLRCVEIENYRSIRRLRLELDDLTTIIGENGSGKSAVFEAMWLCLGVDADVSSPLIEATDFHVPMEAGGRRSDSLSITLVFREEGPGDLEEEGGWDALSRVVTPAESGLYEIRVRLCSRLGEDGVAEGGWSFVDGRGGVLTDDCLELVEELRRLRPMVLLGGAREVAEASWDGPELGSDPAVESWRLVGRMYERLQVSPWLVSREDLNEVTDAVEEIVLSRRNRIARGEGRRRERGVAMAPTESLLDTIRSARSGDLTRMFALCVIAGMMLASTGGRDVDRGGEPLIVLDDIEARLHPTWAAAIAGPILAMPVQCVVSTHSSDVMSWVPLRAIRRLERRPEGTRAFSVREGSLSPDEVRRIGYHIRATRGNSLFSRCWILVEGESEAWLLPEMARILGVEFPAEGIRCVEFAQCGLEPLIKVARDLGIEWHVLADGDRAGETYAAVARRFAERRGVERRVTWLEEPDIEHCLYRHGYGAVYLRAAGEKVRGSGSENVDRTIARATRAESKPGLMLSVLDAANGEASPGVPRAVRRVIEIAHEMSLRGFREVGEGGG